MRNQRDKVASQRRRIIIIIIIIYIDHPMYFLSGVPSSKKIPFGPSDEKIMKI